jgi:hypothetical protein
VAPETSDSGEADEREVHYEDGVTVSLPARDFDAMLPKLVELFPDVEATLSENPDEKLYHFTVVREPDEEGAKTTWKHLFLAVVAFGALAFFIICFIVGFVHVTGL